MPGKPYPFPEQLQTIHGRFESVVVQFAAKQAVSDGIRSLTYHELNIRANQLAHQIIGLLGHGNENVALYQPNTIEQIVTILGIMKAGKTYVPLDTGFPDARNREMIVDAGCRLLITDTAFFDRSKDFSGNVRVVDIGNSGNEWPQNNPETAVSKQDNAILLYTSGSTGEPKGVIQTHENMVHFIKRMTAFVGILPDDRFAYYLSAGFSAHALPLLGALLNGCGLHLYHEKEVNFLGFAQWFRDSRITASLIIPSFLRHLMDTLEPGNNFPDFRLLLLGGETLYRSDVDKARKYFGNHTVMVNILASTEAYLSRGFVMNHNTPLLHNLVPVGFAVDGIELIIKNENGLICKENETGEIFLRSPYVTPGYWNKPELTSRDVTNETADSPVRLLNTHDRGFMRDDGCVIHLGRNDTVVKMRGYRIDLAATENVLLGNPEVREAACNIMTNNQEVEHLVAFVVQSAGEGLDLSFLKAKTAKILPDYMVPTYFVVLDALPKNASGKMDRSSLPQPDWLMLEQRGEIVNATDETEQKLVDIFEKALNIKPIGVTENLFSLGADSLRLFVAFNSIEKQLGVRLNVDQLIAHPTIKELARNMLNT